MWFEHIRYASPNIEVETTMVWKNKVIEQDAKIKFRYMRETFKFGALVTNMVTGSTWIDCMDIKSGQWRSIPLEKFKEPVLPKKRRKRRVR